MGIIIKLVYRPVDYGAQTQIMLAVEPDLNSQTGKYFADCKEKDPKSNAMDEETQKWLWEESAKMTGL